MVCNAWSPHFIDQTINHFHFRTIAPRNWDPGCLKIGTYHAERTRPSIAICIETATRNLQLNTLNTLPNPDFSGLYLRNHCWSNLHTILHQTGSLFVRIRSLFHYSASTQHSWKQTLLQSDPPHKLTSSYLQNPCGVHMRRCTIWSRRSRSKEGPICHTCSSCVKIVHSKPELIAPPTYLHSSQAVSRTALTVVLRQLLDLEHQSTSPSSAPLIPGKKRPEL